MRQSSRRRVAIIICCVATIAIFNLLEAPGDHYYGDVRLIPYEKYFVPSLNEQTFLGHDFLITSDVCAESGGPYLLVMVLSVFNMTSQREAIRNTWGSVAREGHWPGVKGHFDVKLVFLFGVEEDDYRNEQLKEEASSKGDIVQASFMESYDNLTLKVLMGFKWVKTKCPDTQFVMKVDEDVFVNIPHFIRQLNSSDWSKDILGPFSYGEFVIRDGRYRASKSYYPEMYPPHVKGNMYVMAKHIAMTFLNTAPFLPYLRIEDAFITGVLAKIHGIRHVDIPEVMYDRYLPAKYCDIVNKVKVMSQQYTSTMMHVLWNMIKDSAECARINTFIDYFIR